MDRLNRCGDEINVLPERKRITRRKLCSLCVVLLSSGTGLVIQTDLLTARSQERDKNLVSLVVPLTAPAPPDNLTTPEKVELGKQLFFDPRLSGDNTRSCVSCHVPENALTNSLPRARGAGGKQLLRNTPTLLNVGFYNSYFWDGRAASLEEQALVPIQSLDEMNQNVDDLEKELNATASYRAQFQAVFGSPATKANIAKALAAFQRTLISRNSAFDRFLTGDSRALSEEAQHGWELFKGDAGCIRCHNGPNLSDGKFYRLGIGLGDKGRGAITAEKSDQFAFRTPGLRDAARTAPYMHDGSIETLWRVVEFYYRGALEQTSDGLPTDIRPLMGQSYSEISDIVAFLESLTGEPIHIIPPKLP